MLFLTQTEMGVRQEVKVIDVKTKSRKLAGKSEDGQRQSQQGTSW